MKIGEDEAVTYRPLLQQEEEIGRLIVDAAFTVHKKLGPGLLEKVYEPCFCHELAKRRLGFERQVVVPILYDGLQFEEGFRIDVLVEKLVICELKAVTEIHPVHEAQLLSYMRLTQKRLGYLINFHTVKIKDGIYRRIL
ncbi:MAG: GxxExxY protein [Caldilineaceae bacterium]